MATRRPVNINLTDEEHLELRHILLTEGDSMAEFFARYARQFIAAKRIERHHPPSKAAAGKKPRERSHPA